MTYFLLERLAVGGIELKGGLEIKNKFKYDKIFFSNQEIYSLEFYLIILKNNMPSD